MYYELLQVINILTSSVELMDLIKNVDTVFHSNAAESPKSVLTALNRYIPTIRQQLQVCPFVSRFFLMVPFSKFTVLIYLFFVGK